MSWFHLVEIWSMIAMDGADIPESWCLGCSLGATHGANLLFPPSRSVRPASCFKRSVFHEYGFGSYMDEVVYRNSPIRYLGDMPEDHPFIQLYNLKKAVICVGTGSVELPESTRQLDRILKAKKNRCLGGTTGAMTVPHDWYWWYKAGRVFPAVFIKRCELMKNVVFSFPQTFQPTTGSSAGGLKKMA